MDVMVFFSIHPIGNGEHVTEPVAKAVKIIRDSGLKHELGPSGTTILGEWDEVMACIKKCHEALGADAPRLSSLIKIDFKPSGLPPDAIRAKVQRVEEALTNGGGRSSGRRAAPESPHWRHASSSRR